MYGRMASLTTCGADTPVDARPNEVAKRLMGLESSAFCPTCCPGAAVASSPDPDFLLSSSASLRLCGEREVFLREISASPRLRGEMNACN